MRRVDRLLVIAGAIGATVAVAVGVRAMARAQARRDRHAASAGATGAGVMFAGAIDEVELGGGLARPMRPDALAEGFDPEEVPSELPVINELRAKMPFG